jgi:hypothetical protein
MKAFPNFANTGKPLSLYESSLLIMAKTSALCSLHLVQLNLHSNDGTELAAYSQRVIYLYDYLAEHGIHCTRAFFEYEFNEEDCKFDWDV